MQHILIAHSISKTSLWGEFRNSLDLARVYLNAPMFDDATKEFGSGNFVGIVERINHYLVLSEIVEHRLEVFQMMFCLSLFWRPIHLCTTWRYSQAFLRPSWKVLGVTVCHAVPSGGLLPLLLLYLSLLKDPTPRVRMYHCDHDISNLSTLFN